MTIEYRRGELKVDFTYQPFRATIAMVEFCPKVTILHCKTDTGEIIEVTTFDTEGEKRYNTGDIIEGYLPCYKRNFDVRRFLIDGYAVDQEPMCYIRVAVAHEPNELLNLKIELIEMIKSYDDFYSLKGFKDKILADKAEMEDNIEITEPSQEQDSPSLRNEIERFDMYEVWGE